MVTADESKQSDEYERYKKRQAERSRRASASGRDIGGIPPVVDPGRREAAEQSFRSFCESYHAEIFNKPWSPDHEKTLDTLERTARGGGMHSLAMPRGSGKTSLCEALAEWVLLIGLRHFVYFIGSDAGSAQASLETIAKDIETNDLLLEDFPEVCYPIRCLEGIHNRAGGQTHQGSRTHIQWTRDYLSFPVIEGSVSSGSVVKVAGITGRIRGAKAVTAEGKSIRPDFAIIDDPQTDESARSPQQCATRERIIAGAIMGLAGPGKKIAAVMPCTVIYPGDLADTMLDPRRHPEWNGSRTKLLTSMPKNEEIWSSYGEVLQDCWRNGESIDRANEFYVKNREAMDAGAEASWPERFNEDEVSAVQHAMNLYIRDPGSFWSEYQNDPQSGGPADLQQLNPNDLIERLSRVPRGVCPVGANLVTAFIDVQDSILWWIVCAWRDDFTGWVIDYGTYPDQKRRYVTMRDISRTMRQRHPGTGFEGAVFQSLESLCGQLFGTVWNTDAGNDLRLSQMLIDANWGDSTDIVYQYVRQSQHAANILPSHGRKIVASSKPMSAYKTSAGDRRGLNWLVSNYGKRKARYVTFDANFWKTFIAARLVVSRGDRGGIDFYGSKEVAHKMLVDHLCAEVRHRVEVKGRTVDEWRLPTNKPDNHLLDGLVGCAVGASIRGCRILEQERQQIQRMKTRKRRPRVAYMEV